MGKKHKYTSEQIDFLVRNARRYSYGKLTIMFNETFGLNQQEYKIRSACRNRGIRKAEQPVMVPVPVGTEKVSKTGYITVKTEKRTKWGLPCWRNKHVVVWEAEYGPVPKGHYIIFADGDKRNFSLNNLVKVTRREFLYLNRNKLRFTDAELTKTAVCIAKLGVAILDSEERLGRKNTSASVR